jgi:hypothetical protein
MKLPGAVVEAHFAVLQGKTKRDGTKRLCRGLQVVTLLRIAPGEDQLALSNYVAGSPAVRA